MKNNKIKASFLLLMLSLSLVLPTITFAQPNSAVITGDTEPCPGDRNYTLSYPAITYGYVLDRIEWQVYSVNPIVTSIPSLTVTISGDASKKSGVISAVVYKRNIADPSIVVQHSSGQLNFTARAFNPQLSIPATIAYGCGVYPITVSVSDYPPSQASFSWDVPSGWTILSGQNTPTIQVQTSAGSGGNLGVTIGDTKCGKTFSLLSSITRPSAPTLGAISGGAGCFCAGQTQSFSVPTVDGATSYIWSASGSLYIAGVNGNTVSVGTSGSGGNITCYAVTACGNTNTVSAYIPTSASAPSTPTLTLVGSSPCTDYRREGTLLITNADPCATYYWSGDAGVVVSGSGSSAAVGVPYSGLNAYVYGVNACGTSASGSRNIPATPNCGGGQLRVAALSLNAAPNPFSDRTTLSYTLADDATVNLEVTTPVGKRITTLVNERQKAGDHNVVFDGSRLPTGVYIATLTVTAPDRKSVV